MIVLINTLELPNNPHHGTADILRLALHHVHQLALLLGGRGALGHQLCLTDSFPPRYRIFLKKVYFKFVLLSSLTYLLQDIHSPAAACTVHLHRHFCTMSDIFPLCCRPPAPPPHTPPPPLCRTLFQIWCCRLPLHCKPLQEPEIITICFYFPSQSF